MSKGCAHQEAGLCEWCNAVREVAVSAVDVLLTRDTEVHFKDVFVPDANLLASMVDAAILVVGAAQAPHDVIRRGVESIGRDKILGVVLNRVDQIGSLGVDKYRSYYEDYTTPR